MDDLWSVSSVLWKTKSSENLLNLVIVEIAIKSNDNSSNLRETDKTFRVLKRRNQSNRYIFRCFIWVDSWIRNSKFINIQKFFLYARSLLMLINDRKLALIKEKDRGTIHSRHAPSRNLALALSSFHHPPARLTDSIKPWIDIQWSKHARENFKLWMGSHTK